MSTQEGEEKKPTLYDVLELDVGATEDQIKRQYKKLSLKFHPDKNPKGIERFKDISSAYKVLSVSALREVYDQYGEDGLEKHRSMEQNKEKMDEAYRTTIKFISAGWLIILVLDWLLGFPFEWLLSFGLTGYILFTIEGAVNRYSIGLVIGAELLSYLLIPYSVVPYVANASLCLVAIQLLSSLYQTFDIYALAFVGFMGFEVYGRTIPVPWDWVIFLAYHTVAMAFPAFLVVSAVVSQEYVPSSKSKVKELVTRYFPRHFYFPLYALLPWTLFWAVDYYLNISLEWMIVPVLFFLDSGTNIVNLVLRNEGKYRLTELANSLSAIFAAVVGYYFVPSYILSIMASVVVNLVFLVILAQMELSPDSESLFAFHIFYPIVFCIILYVDVIYRDYGRYWLVLAAITTTGGLTLLFQLIFFPQEVNDPEQTKDKDEDESEVMEEVEEKAEVEAEVEVEVDAQAQAEASA